MALPMTLILLLTYLSILNVYGDVEEDKEYKRELQKLGLLQRDTTWHIRRLSNRFGQQQDQSLNQYSSGSNQYSGGLSNRFLSQRWPEYHGRNRRCPKMCVGVGVSCDADFFRCCGSAQCYWEHGYSMRTMGVCVECVVENGKCQRNSQCCGNLQCEKGNFLWLNGDCKPKRTSGHCYQDSQCQTDCKKKWWAFTGECE